MTENNAAVTNVVTLEHGNSSASGLVLPAQSADSSILIQCLKDILAKDTAGTSYNRELREVAHRLSIALETPGDTVQRIAYYVRKP